MSPQKNNAFLVVTNPLHYTYFYQEGNRLPAIGSSQNSLTTQYWHQLCGDADIQLFPVKNDPGLIAKAHAVQSSEPASYIMWKAVQGPYSILGVQFALRDALERKANIRSVVEPDLFPEFAIIDQQKIETLSYGEVIGLVQSSAVVLQVDFSTGGQGTYFIRSEADFQAVYDYLKQANQTQRIVVSRLIEGESFAVQCFVSGKTIHHMNWWHRDLVGLDGVCNNDLPPSALQGATRYAGAVLQNIPKQYLEQIETLAQKVGVTLIDKGYQGIFGMDIVVERDTSKVYLIEVNPRVTAVSHIYATAMRALDCGSDFLTESVKDLIGNVRTPFKNMDARLPNPYFYLKLQNTHSTSVALQDACRLGVYQDAVYKRFGFGIAELQGPNEVIVIPEGDITQPYEPGKRMFSVVGPGDPIGPDGKLKTESQQLLDELRARFTSV